MEDHMGSDIAALIAPFTFIAGVWMYLTVLCRAWSVVIIPLDIVKNPRKLPDFIAENNVSYTYMPPRVLKMFRPVSDSLKMVITGSEKVTNTYSDKFRIVNCYGMTETCATVVTFEIDKLYDNTPCGRPLLNDGAYILDENGKMVADTTIKSKINSEQSAQIAMKEVLDKVGLKSSEELEYLIGTGYGRNKGPLADENISELSCHAMGVHVTDPSVKAIIDIGGQDVKGIAVDTDGTVKNFAMNDKCAAGTLFKIAKVLSITVDSILEDYHKVFHSDQRFAGGFIWEWSDHAIILGTTQEGKVMYGYGGDFDERSLQRWVYNTRSGRTKATKEQCKQLEAVFEKYADYCLSGDEYAFSKRCEDYQAFVSEYYELPTKETNLELARWFEKYFIEC